MSNTLLMIFLINERTLKSKFFFTLSKAFKFKNEHYRIKYDKYHHSFLSNLYKNSAILINYKRVKKKVIFDHWFWPTSGADRSFGKELDTPSTEFQKLSTRPENPSSSHYTAHEAYLAAYSPRTTTKTLPKHPPRLIIPAANTSPGISSLRGVT